MSTATVTARSIDSPAAPASVLIRLLDDLESLLLAIDPDVYCAPLVDQVSGTIGEHVRHALDHMAALLAADPSTTLTYDRRQRGTAVESSVEDALHHIMRLQSAVESWSTRSLDEPVLVTSMISSAGERVTGWSTLARELAFVVSHTIHHHAMIAVLLAMSGYEVPDRFGHAPSTPRRH